MARAGNQPTISTRFSKRKKPQGNSWVIIQVDLVSNDKIESEGRLPGKSLTRLSPQKALRTCPFIIPVIIYAVTYYIYELIRCLRCLSPDSPQLLANSTDTWLDKSTSFTVSVLVYQINTGFEKSRLPRTITNI